MKTNSLGQDRTDRVDKMTTLLQQFDKVEKDRAKVRAKVVAQRLAKIQAQWAEEERLREEGAKAWIRMLDEVAERNAVIWSYRNRLMTVPAYGVTREQVMIASEYNVAEGKKIVEELKGHLFQLDILRDLGLPLPE
jgi:hypothetical protein